MIAIEKNTIELACFEANEHGRLLSGNRRFCRMFGFQESEIQWHYVTDLCRRAGDWESFCNSENPDSMNMRMKNRKGRSFSCRLFRSVKQDDQGNLVYSTTVHRVGDSMVERAVVSNEKNSVVFLAKCAHCGAQIPVATAGEARVRMMCDRCAATEYPEAYNLRSAQV